MSRYTFQRNPSDKFGRIIDSIAPANRVYYGTRVSQATTNTISIQLTGGSSLPISVADIDKTGSNPVITGTSGQDIALELANNFFFEPDAGGGGGSGAGGTDQILLNGGKQLDLQTIANGDTTRDAVLGNTTYTAIPIHVPFPLDVQGATIQKKPTIGSAVYEAGLYTSDTNLEPAGRIMYWGQLNDAPSNWERVQAPQLLIPGLYWLVLIAFSGGGSKWNGGTGGNMRPAWFQQGDPVAWLEAPYTQGNSLPANFPATTWTEITSAINIPIVRFDNIAPIAP